MSSEGDNVLVCAGVGLASWAASSKVKAFLGYCAGVVTSRYNTDTARVKALRLFFALRDNEDEKVEDGAYPRRIRHGNEVVDALAVVGEAPNHPPFRPYRPMST